jgi:two-component system sensor histidine kinase QseC
VVLGINLKASVKANTFSLRNRLLIMIIGCVTFIWVAASLMVWFDAREELEELFRKIIENNVSINKITHEKNEILVDLLWGLIWPLIIGLPVLTVIIYGVVFWASSSITKLQRAITERSANSLEKIEVSGLPEEISPLLNELNELLSKVKISVEHEKRFTADAAHELRTPLAAIKAQAEVIRLERVSEPAAFDNLIESCDRASRLIEQLLALARVETSVNSFEKDDLSISELIARQIAYAYPQIEAKSQTIEFDDKGQHRVKINKTLLEILFRNLLDNAIRYSPQKGKIIVSSSEKNGHVYLSIEDSGAGLTKDQINKLGVRFQRLGQVDSYGSGLGWSIIQKISEVEKLTIQVARGAELGGLFISIKFA